MDRLPQDVLAAILARLAPRGLAASRCVCKQWRATVDARCKLRADLLPISLAGIFVSLSREPAAPVFFARPSMAHKIDGKLEKYVDKEDPLDDIPYIMNCCNGLILLYGRRVVNLATRQCALLPPYPPSPDGMEGILYDMDEYLVVDPTVSPHYEVILLPYIPLNFDFKGDLLEGTEWPPSPCTMQVFSSRTIMWEHKSFIREGEPAGTIADIKQSSDHEDRHAVYWRETLYVHCKGDFFMRITLSNLKYQVIKLPEGSAGVYYHTYLGKSKNGVYLALVDRCRLQVWFLNEFGDNIEWVLKSSMNIVALKEHHSRNHFDRADRSCILQAGNYDKKRKEEPTTEMDFDWNSDDDNALDVEDWDPQGFCGFQIFGFHPYKEIIFLHLFPRVVAFHFNSSKYQDFGKLHLNCSTNSISTAFIYTPCWIGELSENN